MTFTAFLVKSMKVSELIDTLNRHFSLSDDIAVKFYSKDEFDVNLEHEVSDKNWAGICERYDQDDNIDQMSRDFLQEECFEYEEEAICDACDKKSCVCDDFSGLII